MKYLLALMLAASPLLGYTIVHTSEVEELIGNTNVIIIDARTEPYDDGLRIPGALFLPHDTPDAVLLSILPCFKTPIIVYCTGSHCPASLWLAERLDLLGYRHVFEYVDGIEGWISSGNDYDVVY